MSTIQPPQGLYPFDPKKVRVGQRILFKNRQSDYIGKVVRHDKDGYAMIVFDNWSEEDKEIYTWPFDYQRPAAKHYQTFADQLFCYEPMEQTLASSMFHVLVRNEDIDLLGVLNNG